MESLSNQSIFSAKLFIERNLGESLSGQIIAEQVFSSYHHFQHKFKDFTGESLWQYVKRLRLEKACFLLIYTSLPISEIAIIVGFETTATFSKAFSAFKILSPQNFRNKFQTLENRINAPHLDWNSIREVRQPAKKILSFRAEGIQHFPEGYFKWLDSFEGGERNVINLIGRSPDQPGITSSANLRWDTAIPDYLLPDHMLVNSLGSFFDDYIPAGNYLILPYTGFGTPLTENFPNLLRLLHQQGIRWNPAGYFHQVLRKHSLQNQCITDLYIPII